MSDILKRLRATNDNNLLGAIRAFIGMMFIMAGAMKLLVPMLADAWNGQLTQAGIPLLEFNLRFVPLVEVAVGAALVAGFYSRLASVVVIVMYDGGGCLCPQCRERSGSVPAAAIPANHSDCRYCRGRVDSTQRLRGLEPGLAGNRKPIPRKADLKLHRSKFI